MDVIIIPSAGLIVGFTVQLLISALVIRTAYATR